MKTITNMMFIAIALISQSTAAQVCAKRVIVPEYPPIAWAARWTGTADLIITVGPEGKVVDVVGKGARSVLIDHAQENVRTWTFCSPEDKGSGRVHLRFQYRLLGAPVYPRPTAKVLIDLGAGVIVITSRPGEPQP